MGIQVGKKHYITHKEFEELHDLGLLNIFDIPLNDEDYAVLAQKVQEEELMDAFATLALKELCVCVSFEGGPIICDWASYQKQCDLEFNPHKLTEKQFNLIKSYLENNYKGKI